MLEVDYYVGTLFPTEESFDAVSGKYKATSTGDSAEQPKGEAHELGARHDINSCAVHSVRTLGLALADASVIKAKRSMDAQIECMERYSNLALSGSVVALPRSLWLICQCAG